MSPLSPADDFLVKAFAAAKEAQHIWPDYAACEAALESAWGTSGLAKDCNNLFGRKASHGDPPDSYVVKLTKEFIHGAWITTPACWKKFSNWHDCFVDRMDLLHRLSSIYGDALTAPDGPSFVTLVSKHWSTDPDRGAKVLEIYRNHKGVLI